MTCTRKNCSCTGKLPGEQAHTEREESRFGVIVLASVAAAVIIYWTWFGGLFG